MSTLVASPRDIGPNGAYLLGMTVGTMIKPLVDYLISIGKKIVARMLDKRAYIIGYNLEETVKPNVDCLVKAKMSKEQYSFQLESQD